MEVKIKLGKHCFTEAYNCDHKLLNDEEFLKEQIIAAINKTETMIGIPKIVPFPPNWSATPL